MTEVVDTGLYDPVAFDEHWDRLEEIVNEENQAGKQDTTQESCGASAKARGEDPCCETKGDESRIVESQFSEVVLPVENATRHSSRFGITSLLISLEMKDRSWCGGSGSCNAWPLRRRSRPRR